MTLLMLVNLGLGASGVAGPVFNAAWASQSNKTVGPRISPR